MIVGTFNRIPKRESSHSLGWAKVWSDMTGEELDTTNSAHDTVKLLHGANFGGGLNLFGGFTPELEQSIRNLLQAKSISSLEYECPDYGALLIKRKDVKDKELCEHLSDRLRDIPVIDSHHYNLEHLAIGDSHTAAYSPSKSAVIKRDGTTLNSQIKSDFEYIRGHLEKGNYKSITISLGNIDIRHHVVRLNADYKQMLKQLDTFGRSLGIPVEYSAPWPIEYEGRRLPKSGFYKGQPFWGSLEERRKVVSNWKTEMLQLGMDVVLPPEHWYDIDPEQYAKDFMEYRGSVHLSPKYYRRYCQWENELPATTLDDFYH